MRITLPIPFTLAEIAAITNGTLTGSNKIIYTVTTDSRECEKEDLFFALRGPNYDGNDFLSEAAEHGAFILSDREHDATLFVKCGADALLQVASEYKKKCSPKL